MKKRKTQNKIIVNFPINAHTQINMISYIAGDIFIWQQQNGRFCLQTNYGWSK